MLLDFLLEFDRAVVGPSLGYIPYKQGVNVLLSNTLKKSHPSKDKVSLDCQGEDVRYDDKDLQDDNDSVRSFDKELFSSGKRPVVPRWSNWIKYEDPYEVFSDGSGGYALFNRDKGDIVALERVRFAKEEDGFYMSILSEGNPFFVTDKPPLPSKSRATEFFRLFTGHCNKVDPSFVREWNRKFDMVARINPVKLSNSAFPMTMLAMMVLFRSIAMGVDPPTFPFSQRCWHSLKVRASL